jgi:hypothetical protein
MLSLGEADMTTTKARFLCPSPARTAAAKQHFWLGAMLFVIVVISRAP